MKNFIWVECENGNLITPRGRFDLFVATDTNIPIERWKPFRQKGTIINNIKDVSCFSLAKLDFVMSKLVVELSNQKSALEKNKIGFIKKIFLFIKKFFGLR
jgi:hypothetical protein